MEDPPEYKTGTEDLTQEELLNNFNYDERLTIDVKELFFISNAIDYCIAKKDGGNDNVLQMMWNGIDIAWNDETVTSITDKLQVLIDKFYEEVY